MAWANPETLRLSKCSKMIVKCVLFLLTRCTSDSHSIWRISNSGKYTYISISSDTCSLRIDCARGNLERAGWPLHLSISSCQQLSLCWNAIWSQLFEASCNMKYLFMGWSRLQTLTAWARCHVREKSLYVTGDSAWDVWDKLTNADGTIFGTVKKCVKTEFQYVSGVN